MVTFVWNNLSICPVAGETVSRTNLLEGNSRRYDISLLRAFGTKCFFMLTVEKKGGKQLAMGPKAQLGAIIGIEDNMPAYRIFDSNPRGKVRKIPMAQVITHELHYFFKDGANWTAEEKTLPTSFIPNLEARANPDELRRYGFTQEEIQQLDESLVSMSDFDAGTSSEGWVAPPSLISDMDISQQGPSAPVQGPLNDFEMPPDPPPPPKIILRHTRRQGPKLSLSHSSPPISQTMDSSSTVQPMDTSSKAHDRVLRERKKLSPPMPQQFFQATPKRQTTSKRSKKMVPLSPVVESPDKMANVGPSSSSSMDISSGLQLLQKSTNLTPPGLYKPEKLTVPQPASGLMAPNANSKAQGMLGTPTGPFGAAYVPPQGREGPVTAPSADFRTPQDVWRQGISKAALRAVVFDPDELALPVILSYRANSPPLTHSQSPEGKIVGTDPSTKPISIPPLKIAVRHSSLHGGMDTMRLNV